MFAFLWENLTGLRFPIQLISRSSELRFSSRPLQPHQSYEFSGETVTFSFFPLNIYSWLCWVFTAASVHSLAAASRGCFLAAARRLLPAAASPTAEHGLLGVGRQWQRHSGSGVAAPGLSSPGSAVGAEVQGLSCSVVCGIFLDQQSNLHPLQWQADS